MDTIWGVLNENVILPSSDHCAMSAVGQKQTCAVQYVMSALPPKADIDWPWLDVRFVPKDTDGTEIRQPCHE
jgi:hypothetical protein